MHSVLAVKRKVHSKKVPKIFKLLYCFSRLVINQNRWKIMTGIVLTRDKQPLSALFIHESKPVFTPLSKLTQMVEICRLINCVPCLHKTN